MSDLSEFKDAPSVSDNLYKSDKPTLTNITNSNIALQFFNTNDVLVNPQSGNLFDAVVQFKPDDFVFYDDIVVKQTTDPNYNIQRVNSYIKDGILSSSVTALPLPIAAVREITGGNHVLNIDSAGIVSKTISNNVSQVDHLEIFTAVDINNKLACIVYKDKQGLSYSLDEGVTIIPIPNNNLLYPLEITSVAIQTYSNLVLSKPSPRIYIGTLREGVKAFTPGDSSYSLADGMDTFIQLESDGELSESAITVDSLDYSIRNIQYLFKQSKANDKTVKPTPDKLTGYNFSHFSGDFAPVYILGIANSPLDSGCPLICYVRSNIEQYNTLGVYDKITRYISLNLRNQVNSFEKDLVYDVYRPSLDTSYTSELGWRVIQETFLNNTVRDPYKNYSFGEYSNPGLVLTEDLPATLVDVIKTININTSFNALATVSGIISAVNNGSTTKLIKFNVNNAFGDTNRVLSISMLPDPTVLPLELTGFTAYWTEDLTKFQLFITTPNKVRRFYGSSWSDFIVSNAWDVDNQTINLQLTKYLYSFYDPGTDTAPVGDDLSVDIKTHLTGLREFSLFNIGNNKHLGIMGSDLGYVFTYFIKKVDDFVSKMSDFREFKLNLYSSWSTDLVCVPEARKIISCTIEKQPPLIYEAPDVNTDPPKRYYLYDPTLASSATSKNGIKAKIFYKNYGYDETKFYFFNKYNSQYFDPDTDVHFDQQIFDPGNSEFIRVEPKPDSSEVTGIKYALDASNLTPFSFLTDSGINNDTSLANYLVTNPQKYKHLKLLLRVEQKLSPIWDLITSIKDSVYTYIIQQ